MLLEWTYGDGRRRPQNRSSLKFCTEFLIHKNLAWTLRPSQDPITAPSPSTRCIIQARHNQGLTRHVITDSTARYSHPIQRHVAYNLLNAEDSHIR